MGSMLEAQEYRWTLCVYIAGDNDLAEYAPLNIQQLAAAASSDDVALAVYLCRCEGAKKVARKLRVTHNAIVDYGNDDHIDSGSVETFSAACTWAFTEFPAKQGMVVPWDHGDGILSRSGGIRGICYDDTTGHYLTDRDLANVFDYLAKLRGKPLDIIGFDACLMANAEIDSVLSPYAQYIISSEETIPGSGWDYTALANALSEKNSDGASVVRAIVSSYKSLYEPQLDDYTLSAIETSAIADVTRAIDRCAELLNRALSVQYLNSVRAALNKYVKPPTVTVFEERDYADLMLVSRAIRSAIPDMRFTLNAKDSTTLKKQMTAALLALEAAITRAVIAEVHGSACPRVAGISIYLPRWDIHSSYRATLWHELHPAWGKFITSYRLGRSSMMHGMEHAAIS